MVSDQVQVLVFGSNQTVLQNVGKILFFLLLCYKLDHAKSSNHNDIKFGRRSEDIGTKMIFAQSNILNT